MFRDSLPQSTTISHYCTADTQAHQTRDEAESQVIKGIFTGRNRWLMVVENGGKGRRWRSVCKPGSVCLRSGSHSSRPAVACRLKRSTRPRCGPHLKEAYSILLWVEFTLPPAIAGGAVRSYRTISPLPGKPGGILSVALVVSLRSPDVIWHPVL